MLQTIRNHSQGWIAKLIVGFIVLTFAIFGIERLGSLLLSNPDSVASVDGQAITQQQINQTINEQVRALAARLGDRFDPSLLTPQLLQKSALNSLIGQTIVTHATQKSGLALSNDAIDRMIREDVRFQVNETYNPDQFQQWLRANNMTPQQFRDGLRSEQLQRQLQSAYFSTAFVLPNEISHIHQLTTQTRDLSYALLSAQQAEKNIHYTNQQLQDYYQQHSKAYIRPEQVKIQYIKLDQSHIAQSLSISDKALKTAYNQQIASEQKKAVLERRISHIFIEGTDTKSEKLAQLLYQQLHDGANFAKLAKQYSKDSTTANKGGDMGLFIAGLFGESFDKTAAALKPGDIAKPVKTQYGYEIIRRNKNAAPTAQPYTKMKESLEKQLREKQAATLFIEQSRQLADISYEADNLQEAAKQFHLTLHDTDFFSRDSQSKGIISNPKVRTAAFSTDVLDGNNSNVIALSPTQAIVIRKQAHRQAQTLPFKQVKTQVIHDYLQDKAQAVVQDRATSLLADLRKEHDFGNITKQYQVTPESITSLKRDDTRIPKPALTEAFRLPKPTAQRASYGSAFLANGDIMILAVTKVSTNTTPLDTKTQNTLAKELANQYGQQDYQSYFTAQQRQADIKIKTPQTSKQ